MTHFLYFLTFSKPNVPNHNYYWITYHTCTESLVLEAGLYTVCVRATLTTLLFCLVGLLSQVAEISDITVIRKEILSLLCLSSPSLSLSPPLPSFHHLRTKSHWISVTTEPSLPCLPSFHHTNTCIQSTLNILYNGTFRRDVEILRLVSANGKMWTWYCQRRQ